MGRRLCEIIVERRPYRLPAKLRHSAKTLRFQRPLHYRCSPLDEFADRRREFIGWHIGDPEDPAATIAIGKYPRGRADDLTGAL